MVHESSAPALGQGLTATRILALTCLANTLTFALCNALKLPVALTPYLTIASLGLAWYLLHGLSVRRCSNPPGPAGWLIGAGFALALILPRLVYPLEWLPDHTVDAVFDDYARLAELTAMTLGDNYPLRHPANQSFTLSFYYAAFLPMAALKLLLPVLTLKDCIFVVSSFYFLLLGASLVEVSYRLTRDRASALLLLFLTTWFAGFDWLWGQWLSFADHNEWWAQQVFERPSQWSSLFTAGQWTVHHFLGFYLPVISWVLLRYTRFPARWGKPLCVPMLLVAALFHSPFGFLPVVLFGLAWLPLFWRRFGLHWAAAINLLLLLAPLSIFTQRLANDTLVFQMALLPNTDIASTAIGTSLLAYLLLLPLVDMAGIPLLLVFLMRHFSRLEKFLLGAALVYFASTFFIHAPLFNNYSMRGLLLPAFVMFTLFARHWRALPAPLITPLLLALVVGGGIGTAKEVGAGIRYALWASNYSRQHWLGLPPHPSHYALYREEARTPGQRYLRNIPQDRRSMRPWLAEKLQTGVKPGQFTNMEREIAGARVAIETAPAPTPP
jgi:hypothetical protein